MPRCRGRLTPPLNARWLRGGWTSHFVWSAADREAYLDVFGLAPRASSPWDTQLRGICAGTHTVAEMKRTDRDKDWPLVTALGVKLLEAGDLRGWLHLFDYDVLIQTAERVICPVELIEQRPMLVFLGARDKRLEVALKAEIVCWQRLHRLRLKVYERAVRSYMLAVKRDDRSNPPELRIQHLTRVEHAGHLLPDNPRCDHGVDRLVSEARSEAARFVPAGSLEWLPDVRRSFIGLG